MCQVSMYYTQEPFRIKKPNAGIGFSFRIIHYKKHNYQINFIIFFQIKGNV